MLKIPKGLKKKKKGKKSKHKEDELFDSAELEEYRRQQQAKQQQQQQEAAEGEKQEGSEPTSHEESEEWRKFKALTSGVDDILKKTQGDLDRIKSTSFFQKKPPGPSEPPKVAVEKPQRPEQQPSSSKKWVGFEEGAEAEDEQKQEGEEQQEVQEQVEEHAEEEEEESEFEDDQDDIFDTSFVDVVASGEVKLAYVPDSPLEDPTGPDPFDTSIVDKVIKVDPKEQKRNLISLGCAVEVLTGKLDKSPIRELSTPKKRPKPQDLLLESFDEGSAPVVVDGEPEPPPKSILDDDPVFEEETSAVLGLPPVTPLAEVKPIVAPVTPAKEEKKVVDIKELLDPELDPLSSLPAEKEEPEDELDDEFAALAAESLAKKPPPPSRPAPPAREHHEEEEGEDDVFIDGDDPFDTTFASQVLPGKCELKIIEKEILENTIPIKIHSVEDKINGVLKSAQPSIRQSRSEGPDVFGESFEPLSIKHRDLLGGSTTDLTKIDQPPIAPKSVSEEPEFEVADPFDTSIAEPHALIGKTELKFLEKELLQENKPSIQIDEDEDFDPRAEEKKAPRPDNLLVGKRTSIPKVVAFDVKFPEEQQDLLAVGQDENSKISKPLTPYYPPKSIEEAKSCESEVDPFDTSFISDAPGKAEIQLLEKELAIEEKVPIKPRLSDPEFDPRGVQEVKQVETRPAELPDILTSGLEADIKLHTPVAPKKFVEEPAQAEDFDPFDTSIANTLIPGKAEIKLLENELIHKEAPPIPAPPAAAILEKLRRDSESFSNLRANAVSDVLELPTEDTSVKPLTPVVASSSSFDQDIDPFDTSCVGDILPGKTEIKLLESELMLN